MRRLVGVVIALATAVGVGAGVGLHLALGSGDARPSLALPALHGQAVWSAGRRPAPGFALRDQDGRLVSLAGEHGRPVVVAFVHSRCAQRCRMEGRLLAAAEREVAPAQRPVLLVIGASPNANVRAWRIPGQWHLLLGSRDALARVWHAYGVAVGRSSTPFFVIDRRGFERAGVIAPFLPPFVADDFRALAEEAA